MTKKITKILFGISFVPIVFVLLYSVYSAFAGCTFLSTSYGFKGFSDAFFLMGLTFSIIPVFPVCFAYQVAYALRLLMKKHDVPEKTCNKGMIACVVFMVIAFYAVAWILLH